MSRVRMGMIGMMAVIVAGLFAGCGSVASKAQAAPRADTKSSELQRVLDRMLASPEIRTEGGFAARVLIAPGVSKMYDPLFMHDHAGTVWINDDGGQEGDKGSQILAIDRNGQVSDVAALGRLLPAIGFDIAPASFMPYSGQIFTVSQGEIGCVGKGCDKGHIVQRIDPTTQREAETFCTLPPAGGADGKGIPSWGMEGRFGPEGSPFAGKFFAVTATNNTVYQVTSDGRCTPFVSFDAQKWGGKPFGLAFSLDGRHMLVSMLEGGGIIARVRADGTIEIEPLVRLHGKQLSLWGMEYAPAGFGDYGGQLFLAANYAGERKQTVYQTYAMPAYGEVYRLTPRVS